ncbi:hypothetical protein ACVPOY_10675 [Staphylococcus aureus]
MLNGDEKLAAAKQTAKTDIGRLTDLNNARRNQLRQMQKWIKHQTLQR